jgi:hypothetical protein
LLFWTLFRAEKVKKEDRNKIFSLFGSKENFIAFFMCEIFEIVLLNLGTNLPLPKTQIKISDIKISKI